MSSPFRSEKILDEQPFLSPPEAYRQLLHVARTADRRHVSGYEQDSREIQQLLESLPDIDDALDGYEEDELLQQQGDDLDEILQGGDIDWHSTPQAAAARLGQSDSSSHFVPDEGEFLEDSYYPGFLDDAIQGKVPFSGEVMVQRGNDSIVEGISLLEAFDKRVEYDQQQVKDRLGVSDVGGTPSRSTVGGEDQAVLSPVRDEDVLAAIAGVRIDKKIQNMPESELTKAIDSLTKAEFMHEYQRKYEAMQEMTKRVVGQLSDSGKEQPAGEAPIGSKYPKFSVVDVGAGDSMNPLEIVSYIGSTRGKIEK